MEMIIRFLLMILKEFFVDEDLNDLLNSELSLIFVGWGEEKLVTFDRLFWIADWLIGETQKWMGRPIHSKLRWRGGLQGCQVRKKQLGSLQKGQISVKMKKGKIRVCKSG